MNTVIYKIYSHPSGDFTVQPSANKPPLPPPPASAHIIENLTYRPTNPATAAAATELNYSPHIARIRGGRDAKEEEGASWIETFLVSSAMLVKGYNNIWP